jgi:hypothetical protein
MLAFLVNMYVPLIIFLEGSSSGTTSGGGGSSSSGGAKGDEDLSEEALARRRRLCLAHIVGHALAEQGAREKMYLLLLISSVGMAAGGTMGRGRELVTGDEDDAIAPQVPAALTMLHSVYSNPAPGGKRVVEDWVPSDPFLGPLFRSRCCSTCKMLPAGATTAYMFCSACKDPKAGRFCCKDPCFVAFWKAGHKKTCAGLDKLKEAKKGGK